MLVPPALRPRSPKLRGLGPGLAAYAGRWGRQRGDGGGLVVEVNVGVDSQGQADVAMPGRRLGHLGRQPGPLQAGDEQVAVGVEIGKQPAVVQAQQQAVVFRELASAGRCRPSQSPEENAPTTISEGPLFPSHAIPPDEPILPTTRSVESWPTREGRRLGGIRPAGRSPRWSGSILGGTASRPAAAGDDARHDRPVVGACRDLQALGQRGLVDD